MAKVSVNDKMRIQTLREQGYGAKAICKAYPNKGWSLSTVSKICKRVDERGSAAERKVGSGRPRTARTEENIDAVDDLICSQENRPGTSKSTRQIALQLQISERSVRNIAHKDLGLKSFKRVPVQVITDATMTKRLERCKCLLGRLTEAKCKRVFFTDEKAFYLDPPVCSQNNRVWSAGRKRDIAPQRLLLQRAKFSQHLMVSAGVCFSGKGKLNFVAHKVKSMQIITHALCCHSYLMTAAFSLAMTSSFNKMAHQHTQLIKHSSFCRITLQTSLAKTNGLPTRLT